MSGTELTTPAVLDRIARDLPDHKALITEDRVLTFAQLRHEVRRAAAAMIALGVETGDRVAIWSQNTWHWVVAAMAAHYAGAVVVPVNINFTVGEAGEVLARSRARVLFATDVFPGGDRVAELDRAALPALRHIVRIPVGSGDRDWADFLRGPHAPLAEVDGRAAAVHPDHVADIMFTSGTTGRSKGAVCAHRQSLSASAAAAECREMTVADRYLCVAPFFHNYGYKDGILGCLQSGATLVTQRTFDPERAMRVIADERITRLSGPPALFAALLNHPARGNHDLSSLRLASTGGATVPVVLLERILRELGVETVSTGYGLSEASGFGTMCRRGDDAVTVASTCGQPIAGFEMRIDAPDDTGAGEVLLRGPNVMLGYLDDPEATAAAIDADGWLHTGDVGTMDEAGYLRITDRLKDMYICGGVNVYPAEIEQVLARLDAVADAAVIGVPDGRLGEAGRAFVVRHPGAQLSQRTVIAFAREHLAHFKTPRSVVFVDELPRNAAGKVLKTSLREIAHAPTRLTPQGLGGPPVGRVEEWVADVWQFVLDIERPGRRDTFVDLGGDSVAAMEFSGMLESHFGVSMSLDRLAECPTIAAVVADLQAGKGQRRQPVVHLRTDDTGPVCLMVPGIGGHAWKYVPLARDLSVPCDVWALSLMDLRDGPAGQIRDRVRSEALRALRPQVAAGRPIVVGGYSFGGLIAADLSCWLARNGVPVAKLILLDPDPLDSAIEPWDPSTSRMNTMNALVFVPGSAAARKLDAEITAMMVLLQDAYLDGSVRLPQTPVAWIQSQGMAAVHQTALTIFGTPSSHIEKTVIELDHLAMMEIPGVRQVADWMDRQLT